VAHIAVLQQRVREHRRQRRRDRHGQPPVHVVAFQAVEHFQQGDVRLGDRLVEPVFFEEIVPLRVADEGEVGVQHKAEISQGHLRSYVKDQAFLPSSAQPEERGLRPMMGVITNTQL
jgi:hypothetical protein